MEKKTNIGNKAKVCIVWTVKAVDYTKEKENNIKAAFAKKYEIPESNIIIEKNFKLVNTDIDTGLNAENIKKITDPAFQQSLFKQYIAEN